MPVEVACGSCQGRLLADTPGIVVVCPHCGSQLTIPSTLANSEDSENPIAFDAPPSDPPAFAPSADAEHASARVEPPREDTGFPNFDFEPRNGDAEFPSFTEPSPNRDAQHEGDEAENTSAETPPAEAVAPNPNEHAEHTASDETTASSDPALPDSSVGSANESAVPDVFPGINREVSPEREDGITGWFPIDDQITPPPAPNTDGSGLGFVAETEPSTPANDLTSAPATPVAEEPSANDAEREVAVAVAGQHSEESPTFERPVEKKSAPQSTSPPPAGVSRTTFLILVSYASAITLAFIILLIRSLSPDPHHLESLPDLVPKIQNDKVAYELVPESASMARGHVLKLGEGQRFGSLRVTPVRVTRGPLEFVHFTGDATQSRSPEGPVLKLWLRIENVSEDQVFAPLDRKLLLTRVPGDQQRSFWRSNNFVCRLQDKSAQGQKVLVYDLPPTSSWEWKGHDDERELAPGEVYETYIPTTEDGIDKLSGDLVWRVHFRKGYNPESFRGVTTLIEVRFRSDQINAEPGLANS